MLEIDDDEKFMIFRDLNGHVGAGVESFDSVYAWCGFGKRNVEGEIILEFADASNFAVANTWFKNGEGRLIIYEIPEKCSNVIDYILIGKRERKLIREMLR